MLNEFYFQCSLSRMPFVFITFKNRTSERVIMDF